MKKYSNGFTLVEIIVSLAIFAIVAVVALGALVKIISANNKAQTLQTAITNMNYALESISREMRVGKTYHCGTDRLTAQSTNSCSTGLTADPVYIYFKSSKTEVDPSNIKGYCNLWIGYRISNDTNLSLNGVKKWKQKSCLSGGDFPTSDDDFSSIIDSNVTLDSHYINITNTTNSIVTIRLTGHTGVREREKTYFDVQTAVYARVQDN